MNKIMSQTKTHYFWCFRFLLFLGGVISFLFLPPFCLADEATTSLTVPAQEKAPPTVGGGMPAGPTPPEGGFRILIKDGAEYTNIPTVTLKLFGGPNTEMMAISNFPDFRDTVQELYISTKKWDLCSERASCPEGEYTVYVKFYTPWGRTSEVVLDSIIYKKPIPEWIIEQIRTKIKEITRRIADLRKQITQLFKKEVVVEVPERPPEEIAPPVKELPKEEIISPEEIPSEKEEVKEGPIYLLKECRKWLWQSVQVLGNKIWLGLQKIWPF